MITTINNRAKTRSFNSREVIPQPDNCLWLLETGMVKTCTWSKEGTGITLGYWGAGDIIGQPLSKIKPYQIQCLTSVRATLVPLHQKDWLWEKIYRYSQQTEELLSIVHTEKMYDRLYKILVWLANKFGRQVALGRKIELPLTHQELAEVMGTTRVTVTRLINQLEQNKIISRPQRRVFILHTPKTM